MAETIHPPGALAHESYIVSEGKKRGATREVRDGAVHDRFYTVLRVHAGDAILTDNWHTTEVLNHVRGKFAGYTFAMRTLEAFGALVESDRRAYYTAGGREWVFDLEPSAEEKAKEKTREKKRLPGPGTGKK
ncbi:MAG: hypothetical protein ACHQC8_06070 [Solirubrobacterales bacterium]